MTEDLNRLKVILAEKRNPTSGFLNNSTLVKPLFQSGAQIGVSQALIWQIE
jgi:hypothetical protein